MTPPRRQKGWIWPKDPRPGNPPKWPFRNRLKDVLQNKGPDIFVGTIDGPSATPHTPRWSRWQDVHGHIHDGDEETRASPFRWADRGEKRYDFRMRKYRVPDDLTWSRVEYCNGGVGTNIGNKGHYIPLWFWDRWGGRYQAIDWHDVVHGPHEDHLLM